MIKIKINPKLILKENNKEEAPALELKDHPFVPIFTKIMNNLGFEFASNQSFLKNTKASAIFAFDSKPFKDIGKENEIKQEELKAIGEDIQTALLDHNINLKNSDDRHGTIFFGFSSTLPDGLQIHIWSYITFINEQGKETITPPKSYDNNKIMIVRLAIDNLEERERERKRQGYILEENNEPEQYVPMDIVDFFKKTLKQYGFLYHKTETFKTSPGVNYIDFKLKQKYDIFFNNLSDFFQQVYEDLLSENINVKLEITNDNDKIEYIIGTISNIKFTLFYSASYSSDDTQVLTLLLEQEVSNKPKLIEAMRKKWDEYPDYKQIRFSKYEYSQILDMVNGNQTLYKEYPLDTFWKISPFDKNKSTSNIILHITNMKDKEAYKTFKDQDLAKREIDRLKAPGLILYFRKDYVLVPNYEDETYFYGNLYYFSIDGEEPRLFIGNHNEWRGGTSYYMKISPNEWPEVFGKNSHRVVKNVDENTNIKEGAEEYGKEWYPRAIRYPSSEINDIFKWIQPRLLPKNTPITWIEPTKNNSDYNRYSDPITTIILINLSEKTSTKNQNNEILYNTYVSPQYSDPYSAMRDAERFIDEDKIIIINCFGKAAIDQKGRIPFRPAWYSIKGDDFKLSTTDWVSADYYIIPDELKENKENIMEVNLFCEHNELFNECMICSVIQTKNIDKNKIKIKINSSKKIKEGLYDKGDEDLFPITTSIIKSLENNGYKPEIMYHMAYVIEEKKDIYENNYSTFFEVKQIPFENQVIINAHFCAYDEKIREAPNSLYCIELQDILSDYNGDLYEVLGLMKKMSGPGIISWMSVKRSKDEFGVQAFYIDYDGQGIKMFVKKGFIDPEMDKEFLKENKIKIKIKPKDKLPRWFRRQSFPSRC